MTLYSLDSLLKKMLSQPQWDKHIQYYQLRTSWYEVVNEKIAQYTQPVFLQDEVFFVAVKNAVWAQDLTLQRLNFLRKINSRSETPIKDIRFITAKWLENYLKNLPQEEEKSLKGEGEFNPLENYQMQPCDEPKQALNQWLEMIKTRNSLAKTCPKCERFCPEKELQRWGFCALCFRDSLL